MNWIVTPQGDTDNGAQSTDWFCSWKLLNFIGDIVIACGFSDHLCSRLVFFDSDC